MRHLKVIILRSRRRDGVILEVFGDKVVMGADVWGVVAATTGQGAASRVGCVIG